MEIPLGQLTKTILGWIDVSSVNPVAEDESPYRVDWVRIIPFIGMHLACFAVFWVGWSWVAVGTAAFLYFARMFFVTGFYHRYFSHRTFKTSRAWQFVFAVAGNTCVQRGPLWWAAHHRHHHRHSDTEEDYHSPHAHGFWWSHMGWITTRKAFPTNWKLVPDLAKFPELRFLNRFDTLVPLLFAAALFTFGAVVGSQFPGTGTNGWQTLVWGFFVSTIAVFHASCTINSLTHMFGKRRFATKDDSRNSFLLSLLTLGEGWHNNHHRFPGMTRQGLAWWEIDITYYILRGLAALGIIWELNPPPAVALQALHGGAGAGRSPAPPVGEGPAGR